ncbi:hypothetical protein ACIG5E_37105 [Kitasatospora sp. NPDC053057]|uniref:hypothetical protein n=1 Tax=Kitasatospora sp. NPDC053057 TaxID=3364062 RepID=UPI0037C97360
MAVRKYRAISFQQASESKDVVLFAAPATEIWKWSGIPQRELLDNKETIGFQREENPKRIEKLKHFYGDARNIVQNPLLCAKRDERARFEPDEAGESGPVRSGWMVIDDEVLDDLPLLALFDRVAQQLCSRSEQLSQLRPDRNRLETLQARLGDNSGVPPQPEYREAEFEDSVQGLFANETHILEFYQEVICRKAILASMPEDESSTYYDDFLGFTREALESYLKPVFLVDGQHRLRGAVEAAEKAAERAANGDEILARIEAGEDRDSISNELTAENSRILPVSLLMEENVEEHVFQFVVVNQKATPLATALLGTIVATSLSEDELNEVTERLEAVDIDVADSQAVAWFTRSPGSPFHGKVQQGMVGEGGDKLPWTVLRDLISQFRNLRGAKLPHSSKIDYADKWARERLPDSALVDTLDSEEQRTAWATLEGPWRGVCAAFFAEVRDRLGDPGNEYAPNAWGTTKSTLYNKVMLSILVADFFQFLTDKELTIDGPEDCRAHVAKWLASVDKNYFARDWQLSGVKKDTPGIRAQWSELWVDYRKDPQRIPDVRNFRKSKQV